MSPPLERKYRFDRDEEGVIVTPELIAERIKLLETVRETWKGISEYADVLTMEIWAMRTAAAALQRAREAVDRAAFIEGYTFTPATSWRVAMQACDALYQPNALDEQRARQQEE